LPFIYGRILPQWNNSQGVREGQQALTDALPNVFMASADDLFTPTLHYNNAGTMALGNRYAEGFAALMDSRTSVTNQLRGAGRPGE
jgi:hypothetical protein